MKHEPDPEAKGWRILLPDASVLVSATLVTSLLVPGFVVVACGGSSGGSGPDGGPGGPHRNPEVILDGGGGIPPPPEGASLCPPGACNYQSTEGCAANETCRPDDMDTTIEPRCGPVGSKAEGQSCTGFGDCARGLICVGGACRKLCCASNVQGDWSVCPEEQSCFRPLILEIGDAMVPTGASVCFPVDRCDPLDRSACSEGKECMLIDSRGATACIEPGEGEAGNPCPCAGGYGCSEGICRRLCRAIADGGESSCPRTEGVCIHYDRLPDGVGECAQLIRGGS